MKRKAPRSRLHAASVLPQQLPLSLIPSVEQDIDRQRRIVSGWLPLGVQGPNHP